MIGNANSLIDVRLPSDKLLYNQLNMNYDYELYLSIAIRVCSGVSPLHEHMCHQVPTNITHVQQCKNNLLSVELEVGSTFMRAWIGVNERSAVCPQIAMQHNTNTLVLQPSFLVGDRILFYIVAHTSLPFLFFSSSCLLLFIAIT